MRVRELLARLSPLDPEAVVLYLDEYADASDASEIREIVVPGERWTFERHEIPDGRFEEVHHPTAHGLSVGWDAATDTRWEEAVVVLSTGLTNLHYER
jgi:hypothetical protein